VSMAFPDKVARPDLPELEPLALAGLDDATAVVLEGVRVDGRGAGALGGRGLRAIECELLGVTVADGHAPGFELRDVILRGCDLSNVEAREGTLRRVEIHESRLVGFGLSGGEAADVRVIGSSLRLASFAGARLRGVVFRGVDLTEATFLDAELDGVGFLGCRLAGCDFRGARVRAGAIRGANLDGVLGIGALRGIEMPWTDVVASAAAMAEALGIGITDG
jgi:uncharacterized protein YjbI with pentapeptide repeats